MSDRLARWTRGGQFGFLFDNSEDTISFSQFQCFDFQGMSQYPEILEPLLFYILHRANAVIADRQITQVFKAFFIDEAWVFLKNPSIQRYVVEALKTWRKHNAAMVLSTQSLDELRRSDILDVIIESCATKIFLANPDMDRELYRRQFHLNENEVELISNLIPKQQFLIKTPELAKVANLTVDRKSYWLYTNDPYDNRKRREAFENYGFEQGTRSAGRRAPMIAPLILVVILGFFEPGFTFLLHRLQYQVCLEPLLLSWLPLLVAAVATALVIAVNSFIQSTRQEDRLSPNDKSQFRSEQ